MSLGEVCHSQNYYVTGGEPKADYGSTCPDSSLARVEEPLNCPSSNQIANGDWPVRNNGRLGNWNHHWRV